MNNCSNSSGNNFILAATLVSLWLANNLDETMLDIVANFLQTVGQNLASILAINDSLTCDDTNETNDTKEV